MKFKTIIHIVLLLITFSVVACASTKKIKNPESVEEAEAMLAKKGKADAKAAKKGKKASDKRYWSMQSKATKKSVKKNLKRQKRIAKHNRKTQKH